jgi:hypothetical protein
MGDHEDRIDEIIGFRREVRILAMKKAAKKKKK